MPTFALYFVPPAESPFYAAGSQVLGYDVRTGQRLSSDSPARSAFPTFDEAWVGEAQQFGFHLTIGHAIEFEAARLAEIERETEAILNCFDPAKPFTLTPNAEYVISGGMGAVMLFYTPNQALMMFHALVAAKLHPLGTTTKTRNWIQAQGRDAVPAHFWHRSEQYLMSLILDDWYPHFTVLNPYTGGDLEGIKGALGAIFADPQLLIVESVCLLVKADGASHFHLHREYQRSAYPQRMA